MKFVGIDRQVDAPQDPRLSVAAISAPSTIPGPEPSPTRLREIAALFLRLGMTAFGGPAAHVAMMEEQVVRRRRWLEAGDFLDRLGVTALIPGPNSTELAMLVGHARGGFAGLVIAGLCFIVPAAAITLALAHLYVGYGRLAAVAGVLYGVKPVVIAIVLHALW